MNAIDIYEQVKNPLDSNNLMRNFFQAYLKTENFEGFLDYIKRLSETKNYTLENDTLGEEAKRKFLLFMLNLWRNNVINTPIEKVLLLKYNSLEEYLDTKKLLEEIKQVDYIEDKQTDINSSSWYKKDIDYTYITSFYVNPAQVNEIEKEHILYVNINSSSALYRVIELFIIQCIKHNIPYNFKYSNNINNDRTFVVYSDTKNLANYVNILMNICNDIELSVTMSYPKLLSGVIDKYIGYESYVDEDEEKFTDDRLKIIYDILDKEIPKLYDKNFKEDICDYRDVTFFDYIFDELFKTKERILAQKEKGVFHYFRLKKVIDLVKKMEYKKIEPLEIKVGKSDSILIQRSDINDIYINLLNTLFRKYPKYIKNIINKIKSVSEEYDIDHFTFCFDLNSINKISRLELGEDIITIDPPKEKLFK